MKSKDLEKLAKKKKFELARSNGSHRIYTLNGETVIIPVKNGKDMNPNTYRAIKKQILAA